MNHVERVEAVIAHEKPDRMPYHGWLFLNMEDKITEAFGSMAAFEDHYDFDLVHLFSDCMPYGEQEMIDEFQARGEITPADLLAYGMKDVNDQSAYEGLAKAIDHHKHQRGRFTYVQTPGVFEVTNLGLASIENHMMYMALYRDDILELYRRQSEWNKQFAMNCLDLGIDCIHVSDDWGSQNALMFSPSMWWEMIYPYHKVTADAVTARGAHLSLHSCGNFRQVLDGVIELGYEIVHPYQESAGMDLVEFRDHFRDKITMMGGLDIQNTLGFGDYDRLKSEIERVMTLFKDGGLIFCTSHYVQDHCTIDELVFAYDLIAKLAKKLA